MSSSLGWFGIILHHPSITEVNCQTRSLRLITKAWCLRFCDFSNRLSRSDAFTKIRREQQRRPPSISFVLPPHQNDLGTAAGARAGSARGDAKYTRSLPSSLADGNSGKCENHSTTLYITTAKSHFEFSCCACAAALAKLDRRCRSSMASECV